ncbi:GPI-linked NAD(P)(+)--arginine ADP-ribosyltransferase 1 [Dromaius novaehollandiae]|uniref:GPI-linked NAD(P)(+)--arginine ADP-ribosyltransferase 1 n=1 Tax=Dromaius novaehollandiae TaxID=8790 RepID=UPI00311DBE7D
MLLVLLVLLGGARAARTPRELFPVKELPLDMAPDAFDDEYRGCAEAMEAELAELNRTEMAGNAVYAEAWAGAAARWGEGRPGAPRPPALRPAQELAILAYTMQGPLHGAFNAAVREAGRSRRRYLDAFPFKTFHFLLSTGLRALRDAGPRLCRRVYRGVRGVRFAARLGRPVRFGHFASASLRNGSAWRFGQDTFFSVETCCGVAIGGFSFFPEEEEVLIPPSESFEVTGVARAGGRVLIELRSQGSRSTYNCAFLQEKRCKTQPCVFSAGSSSPGAPPSLWGLLLAVSAVTAAGRP